MSAIERIQKFHDDQIKIMVPGTKPTKITSEISKLKTWLVKHQDEAVPDGSKGKILTCLEKYNRAAGYIFDIRSATESLFQDYLALPEGKLLTSKNKDKVKTWLENMVDGDEGNDAPRKELKTKRWDVAMIDDVHRLCLIREDLMHEEVVVADKELLKKIERYYHGEDGCSVSVGEEDGLVIVIEAFEAAS